ncbi:MAG TPA: hypothetical protein VG929_09670 [Actinomycetota bacterium]|nr:hypothetical protein [Actinomycetota bacterium]
MRRGLGFLLILACLLAVASVPVQADTKRITDGDDVEGPLDIAWIKHEHGTNAAGLRKLVHTVRLYERWPVDRLRHRGFINLFFDLRGDPDWREERAVYITYDNGKLRAELYDFAADPPTFLRTVPMWRPNGRTIKFALRKSDLRRRPFSYYRWFALSFIEERHPLCGESGGCDDHAPDRGYVRHDL